MVEFEDFYLINNDKKERVKKIKHGVRREQVSEEFHNLFDAYDTNRDGKLKKSELEVILKNLNVFAGADKTLDANENKLVTSLFANQVKIENADFMGFVKSVSDASALNISVKMAYNKTGAKLKQNSKILTTWDIYDLESKFKKLNKVIEKYRGYLHDSPQGRLVMEDIDMYYKAITQGTDINDLMVPTVKTIKAGLSSASTGDVFEVEDSDNIFIKTGDGTYEKLNISKDTYCKLFPAIVRYSSGQGSSNDCYLVSALNVMMANPKTREKLLSCFTENKDDSVTVKLPNFDTKITIKDGQSLTDLGVNSSEHMRGALGMQLLEYAYKVGLVGTKISEYQTKISDLENKLLGYYNYNVDSSSITFEEYINQLNSTWDKLVKITGDNDLGRDILSLTDYSDFFDSDGNLTDYGIKQLSNKLGTDETEKLNEIASYINNNNNILYDYYSTEGNSTLYIEYKEKLEYVNENLAKSAELLGGKGRPSNYVFKAFGIDNNAKYARIENSKTLDAILNNPDLMDNYVITASTIQTKSRLLTIYNNPTSGYYEYFHNNPDVYQKWLAEAPDSLPYGLVSDHAYGFAARVNETTRETEIVVTNPWPRTSKNKDTVLTVEEFKQYFEWIYVAEVP